MYFVLKMMCLLNTKFLSLIKIIYLLNLTNIFARKDLIGIIEVNWIDQNGKIIYSN